MSVTATNAFTTATGNGAATVFPFTFFAPDENQVQVEVGGIIQTSGFSVIANPGAGGSVTFDTAPANGAAILMSLAADFEQNADFENAGPYLPAAVDAALDQAAARDIYLNRAINRSLRAPAGEALDELPSGQVRAGTVVGFAPESGATQVLSYTALAIALAPLIPGTPGVPGPGTDLTLQVDANGAVGDGTTDDTAAIQSTIDSAAASYRRVRFGAKTYIVTSLTIPDGMVVETAGFGTRIKQKSGTGPDTPIITVTGSCEIGDISVEGQLGQAGDTTGEFNHGIFVDAATSFAAVKIGNVSAKNIRGDAVNFGTGTGVTLGDCQLGDVLLDNVYRNGVAAVGNVHSLRAGTVSKAPSATYGCGFKEVDIEADPGSGNTLGVYFHRVFGRFVGVNATDAADFCDAVEFGSLDLDPSYTPGCNPAFTTTPTNAIEMRACKSLKIGKLKVNGFTGGAIVPVSGASTVPLVITIDEADVTNCQQGGSSTDPYFGPGAGASIEYHIGSLNVTTNLATNRVFQSQTIGAVNIGRVTAALFTGSLFIDTVANGDIGFAEASVNGAGNGGTIFQGCTDVHLHGGNLTGNLLNNTPTRVVIENVTATMATDYISGTVVNCEYNRV